MKTIVFQGDSITDCTYPRQYPTELGNGYVTMTAGAVTYDYPGKYQCINRGVSGNRSVDMYARIKQDVLNLKPDILTVLIGVNDVWHELSRNGVSAEKYEMILKLFIQEVQEACPQCKIFLMEPFVLDGTATNEHLAFFQEEVALRAAACKRVAENFGLPYIPLQEKISAFAKLTNNSYVLHDGVHPTCAGHKIISDALYNALKPVLQG